MHLSHLKWNFVEGGNPTWCVGGAHASSADDWVADWEKFGAPFLERFTGAAAIVDALLDADFLPRSPWVKSDGILSAAPYEFAATLLFRLGRSEAATHLLKQVLDVIVPRMNPRAAQGMKRRCELIMKWGQEGAQLTAFSALH